MIVNNQSNGSVTWVQGNAGPAPNPALVQSGELASGQESQPFTPSGSAPYVVTFTGACSVTSPKIDGPNATVTLDRNCAVTVS